jgi:signal peptide peptidase SppA
MRIPRRFVASLLSRPQMISPAAGAAVVHVLLPGASLDGWAGTPASHPAPGPRDYQAAGSVAVIPVVGELVHRGASMDAMSGLTSYQALDDMISAAHADPSVSAIVLDVDSPGGEASGVLDLAGKIYALASTGLKPMTAVVNSCACSAAYAIAAATGHVAIAPTGIAGSIGVVAYHADVSKALSAEGIDVTYIYAGAHKIDGVETQPLSDPARARLQANVDTIYAQFCAQVAQCRGMTAEAVANTEAGIFMGVEAVDVGLADCIATIEEAIMAMTPRQAAPGARIALAADPATTEATADHPVLSDISPAPATFVSSALPAATMTLGETSADPQAVAIACTDAGFSPLIVGLLRTAAPMSAVHARIAEMREISADLTRLGMSALLPMVMKQGLSREAASELAFAAKAAAGDAMDISTAHDTAPGATARVIDSTAIYGRFNNRARS